MANKNLTQQPNDILASAGLQPIGEVLAYTDQLRAIVREEIARLIEESKKATAEGEKKNGNPRVPRRYTVLGKTARKEIYRKRNDYSRVDLAAKYGVSVGTINNIIKSMAA